MMTSPAQPASEKRLSPAKAWMRALEMTAGIGKKPTQTLPHVIEEAAEGFADAPALVSRRECFTVRGLSERANQYARWALDIGLQKSETVCLLMPNRPEYLAIWLGITRAGGVVALLNTNLTGESLAHCARIVSPKHVIVASELARAWGEASSHLDRGIATWTHGESERLPRIDRVITGYSTQNLSSAECPEVTIEDRALYLYTSGTTGLPKAASISHGRLMQWSHWFAGMMGVTRSDRLYNCLPMYHSSGGILGTAAVLAGGGSVAIGEKFSVRRFWSDVVQWGCTLFQYIGEQCRYLLHADADPQEIRHRLRMACGNGLRPDVWNRFRERFGIPQIFEFYGSTEGGVSLFNIEGKPGAIGRIPKYLQHRSPVVLVRIDLEAGEPLRGPDGFCIRCSANETGEAIGPLGRADSDFGGRFEGYTDVEASAKKILRSVFEPGDAWYRTGDLMRQDAEGYFYFVDRIGDSFRWKGENVSASEVSEAICAFPGIEQALVYGVALPGVEGRAGMAALALRGNWDLAALREHLLGRLPAYAIPLFLRVCGVIPAGATFKPIADAFRRQGYDPSASADPIWFHDRECRTYIRLTQELYDRIQRSEIRV